MSCVFQNIDPPPPTSLSARRVCGEGGGGQYFGRRKTQLCTLPISNPLWYHRTKLPTCNNNPSVRNCFYSYTIVRHLRMLLRLFPMTRLLPASSMSSSSTELPLLVEGSSACLSLHKRHFKHKYWMKSSMKAVFWIRIRSILKLWGPPICAYSLLFVRTKDLDPESVKQSTSKLFF